jgi:2-polyprenyl-3-methyl-5-hydroxy-6-metoxy-1,4-benzoquinol methylase
MNCPVCDFPDSAVIYAGSFYILRRCGACRTNFQERTGPHPKQYDEDYFQSNHRAAYGRTYIEDEANIRAIAGRRLGIIGRLIPPGGRILDVGSALGIFCDEASRRGFRAEGVEVSGYARTVAKKTFGVVSHADIAKVAGPFDALTLWYTLEHMEDPRAFINRALPLLGSGGVIGVAVPNGAGACARFNRETYYAIRPAEHFFEPSPRGLKRLLAERGCRIVRTEFFGLHPDRVGLPDRQAVRSAQKALRLGDTFEVYAVVSGRYKGRP